MAYEDDDEIPFLRRPRNLITAVVAVVIVAIALWMVLGRGDRKSNASPPPTPTLSGATSASVSTSPSTPAESASRPVGSNYDSACGLSGGTTTVPTDTPPGVEWQNVDGWYLPVSNSNGPGKRIPDGPWSCFSRTPTGAVIAAYTVAERVGVAKDFKAVVTQQTVPGVGQSTLLAQGPKPPSAEGVTIPVGFLVDSYTNDDATVTLYVRQGAVSATCSLHVQWFGGPKGDWLLRLETDGGTSSGCIQGAPNRYVKWGPTP